MIAAPASSSTVALERQMAIAEAVRWLGTPFHHHAGVRGAGVDCIHLLAAVYVAAGAIAPPEFPPYSFQWFLHRNEEVLLGNLALYAVPVLAPPRVGDIVTFRFGRAVSHAGIVVEPGQMIHAFHGRGVTLEEFGPLSALGLRFAGAWKPSRWIGED